MAGLDLERQLTFSFLKPAIFVALGGGEWHRWGGFTRIRDNLSASLAPLPPDSMLTDPNLNPNVNPVNHTAPLLRTELQNVKLLHRADWNKILPFKRFLYLPYLWYFPTLTTVHRGTPGVCVPKCTLHSRRIGNTFCPGPKRTELTHSTFAELCWGGTSRTMTYRWPALQLQSNTKSVKDAQI